MAARKAFLLRIDPGLWVALEKWAADDFRSVNGQIEFLLARALREAGRSRTARGVSPPEGPPSPDAPPGATGS